MSQSEVSPLPKLPLGETISLSYAWFFQKFVDVLRISWLWLMLSAILVGAWSWVQWTAMADMLTHAQGTMRPGQLHVSHPFGVGLLMGLTSLVMTLGTVSIAVAWHRRIILGEEPGLSGGNIVTKPLWSYIGVGIGIALTALLPNVLIMVPAVLLLGTSTHGITGNQPSGTAFLLVPVIFTLYLTALAIVLRLSVLLPARAAGDWSLTFGQAWRRTRGNTWRMFWGLIACSVPPLIALQIIFVAVTAVIGFPSFEPTALPGTVPVLEMTIMSAAAFTLSLLIVPIYIGFLSHSYRHFVRGGLDAPA